MHKSPLIWIDLLYRSGVGASNDGIIENHKYILVTYTIDVNFQNERHRILTSVEMQQTYVFIALEAVNSNQE